MTTAAQLNLQTVTYTAQTGFSNVKEVSILQGYTFSQPINYTIIEDKSKKIGYVEISHFDVGQAQSYLQTFQELKNKSITELVVDLREGKMHARAYLKALGKAVLPLRISLRHIRTARMVY